MFFKQFNLIIERLHHMSAQLDTLTAQVTANNSAIDSAITLINGLAQQIIDTGGDPVKLQALVDSLTAEDTKLAAAIVANTPQVPTPTSPAKTA